MAKLNPTSSQDGVRRASVSVEFQLSRADIVSILESYALNVADYGTDLSPREVMHVIREELWSSGYVADSDSVPATEVQRAWAERQVAKVWPS